MSNVRIFWIIWCSFWGLGWLLLGFFFFPLWLFVPFSLLAILLPIGRVPRPTAYWDPQNQQLLMKDRGEWLPYKES